MSIKVVTTCPSRFHIYDQAAQLNRQNLLYFLIHAYPYSILKKWGVEKIKTKVVKETYIDNIIQRLLNQFPISQALKNKFNAYYHEHFSKSLIKYIPADADIIIGLSSFMERAFEKLANNMVKIIDHGSLHLSYVERVLIKEAESRTLNPASLGVPEQWAIIREENEFKMSDYIFLCSDFAKTTFIEQGISADKIFVNPLSVNTEIFYPKNIKTEKFIVLYVGNIYLSKGLYYLIEAFKKLKLKNAELWLVGRESSRREERKYLRDLINNNIKLMGHFQQNDLPEIYSKASLFAFPSLADGFGMVVPQALASGLPVIISENAGAKFLINEGENGYRVEAFSSEALSEKIKKIYTNTELKNYLSENARKCILNNDLTWDGYGDRMAGFLKRLPLKGRK